MDHLSIHGLFDDQPGYWTEQDQVLQMLCQMKTMGYVSQDEIDNCLR